MFAASEAGKRLAAVALKLGATQQKMLIVKVFIKTQGSYSYFIFNHLTQCIVFCDAEGKPIDNGGWLPMSPQQAAGDQAYISHIGDALLQDFKGNNVARYFRLDAWN